MGRSRQLGMFIVIGASIQMLIMLIGTARRSYMVIALPVLVAVVAVLVACPSQAQFTYTTNNGTITITGYTGTNANVAIPSTIWDLPVTSIGVPASGFGAFVGSSITGVTIPNSITNIGDGAFWGCTSAESAKRSCRPSR